MNKFVKNIDVDQLFCASLAMRLKSIGIPTLDKLQQIYIENGMQFFERLPGLGEKSLDAIRNFLPGEYTSENKMLLENKMSLKLFIGTFKFCPDCGIRMKKSNTYLVSTSEVSYKCTYSCECGLFFVKEEFNVEDD